MAAEAPRFTPLWTLWAIPLGGDQFSVSGRTATRKYSPEPEENDSSERQDNRYGITRGASCYSRRGDTMPQRKPAVPCRLKGDHDLAFPVFSRRLLHSGIQQTKSGFRVLEYKHLSADLHPELRERPGELSSRNALSNSDNQAPRVLRGSEKDIVRKCSRFPIQGDGS